MKRRVCRRATCASLWKFCWSAATSRGRRDSEELFECLDAKDIEARRKLATGLCQLADLYRGPRRQIHGQAIREWANTSARNRHGTARPAERGVCAAELRKPSTRKISARWARFAWHGIGREGAACAGEDCVPGLAWRIVCRSLSKKLCIEQVPDDLLEVLRRTSQAAAEHLADRFFRCMRRDECDRMIELVRNWVRTAGPVAGDAAHGAAAAGLTVVGLLSRLDVSTLLEFLPVRLPEWNRLYHDVVVRQIAYGAATDRGRTLLELLEILDPLVVPQAVDEIGMSGDRTAVAADGHGARRRDRGAVSVPAVEGD